MNHPARATHLTTRPARARRWLWGAVGAAALLAVFWLYTRPEFLFTLANQVWACF